VCSSDLFEDFLPLWSKLPNENNVIFQTASNGLKTNRDIWVYGWNVSELSKRIKGQIEFFNAELNRWIRAGRPKEVDGFVAYDDHKISWSRDLKKDLTRGRELQFNEGAIQPALYRPFDRRSVYFDRILNEEVYVLGSMFPNQKDSDNLAFVFTDVGARSPFAVLVSSLIPDVHICSSDAFHVVSYYTYSEDGSNRHENITDWALGQFRSYYKDESITKWDIFRYTYGLLHHPVYRTHYAANLKREVPRIPYAPDFRAFAKAGKRLTELHADYTNQREYPLERKEKQGQKLDLHVQKMRLSKDKGSLIYNDFLSLIGIPKETFEYRLGNRSALDWVTDQHQVSTDTRSGITNDPNRDDDPEYILRLIGQVITVSLETVKIVKALPDLGLLKEGN
jgi:predicted helicase